MNLLLTPNDTLLGKALRLPLRAIPSSAVVRALGGIIKGMKWRVGASNHGCWLGTFEPDKQLAISALVRPGMNVIDVGANAGFYTLAFARMVGPAGHVWAIEPMAKNVENLRFHVEVNSLTNVTIVQAAVSERTGLASFKTHVSNAMGKLTTEQTSLLVPTFRLDELAIPTPDVVKMDIEGGELSALRGAAGILERKSATWLVALDDPDTAADCKDLLIHAGYALQMIAGNAAEVIGRPTTS